MNRAAAGTSARSGSTNIKTLHKGGDTVLQTTKVTPVVIESIIRSAQHEIDSMREWRGSKSTSRRWWFAKSDVRRIDVAAEERQASDKHTAPPQRALRTVSSSSTQAGEYLLDGVVDCSRFQSK